MGVLLGLIILAGTILRLIQADESLGGDEISTLWVVQNNGLVDTIRVVSGDAEITPPLNFILSWFAVRLGSAPELVRLPALLSGIAVIPVVFLLGRKVIGEPAGLAGAAVMALSPFMIFFSGNGRAYTLMVLLLAASTFAMVKADETGRRGWWVAYALLSCAAMYSHYT
ncbi:MAG: glycosyltransferase family 39 protein, partial [Actinomycetota bacterium]|nr:glycosyltransferase family 39 protein [Actinomycetota bacterium]